jgi:hypothetical protein
MYKQTEPIRCPKCGAIVKVDLYKILTSNPPCYEWTCPNCGEKGNTEHGDIISFENQIGRETYQTGYATSGYIQKVGEPDPGVGVTTTNATGDGYNTINAVPSICSPMTECEICGEEFKFDSRSYICPKCREAIVKLRGTADSTANAMPADNKSTVTDPKSTACNIPAPKWIQQGWECPKCGAILAPHQSCCPFCSRKENDWITTVGTGAQPLYAEWTNKDNLTPPSGQYTNPYTNTTISSGGDINFPKGDGLTFNQRGDIIDAE